MTTKNEYAIDERTGFCPACTGIAFAAPICPSCDAPAERHSIGSTEDYAYVSAWDNSDGTPCFYAPGTDPFDRYDREMPIVDEATWATWEAVTA